MHYLSDAEWSARLRAGGLRVTSGRLAVLNYLQRHPHSSAAEVHQALASEGLSLQSTHNIVHDLSACGLLRRVELPGNGGAHYELHRHDNHHHVQCIVCHRIEDVPCAIGAAPCLTPSDAHSMRILEADVIFRGVCPGCESSLPQRAAILADTSLHHP